MSKEFILENYLKGELPFSISLEFNISDEEIQKLVEESERPVSLLDATFFGYTLISINEKFILGRKKNYGPDKYAFDSHPLVHLDSIAISLQEKLTPDPDYDEFLKNAEKYFFGQYENKKTIDRFRYQYQIARDTGVDLNVAIISPDEDNISLIWYNPEIERIEHGEIGKRLFVQEVSVLAEKVINYADKLSNIGKQDAYARIKKIISSSYNY